MNPTWLNPHQLMQFFHVARHGGITPSLPHMPYGIQQPAVSGSLSQLTDEIGATLHHSHPFQLTDAGRELYEYIRPFFEGMPELIERIRTGTTAARLGASELILREYVPVLADRLQAQHPKIHLDLQAAGASDLFPALRSDKLQVAISAVAEIPSDLEILPITRLPLVLLVPRTLAARDFNPTMLNKPGKISLPLICPSRDEGVCARFQSELSKRKIHWHPADRVSSVALVAWFVAKRQCVGLSLDLPILTQHPGVRVIKLPDFPPVDVVALSRPSPGSIGNTLLQSIREYAAELRSSNLVPALAQHSA